MTINEEIAELKQSLLGNQYGEVDEVIVGSVIHLANVIIRINAKFNKYMQKKGPGEIEDE